jgi:hypothetical protein
LKKERVKGVEPSTFTLAKGEHPTVSAADTQVTSDSKCACTSDCTPDTKTSNGDAPGDGIDKTFAEALAMIANLPLTKAEKAEAVRRLLASKGVNK